MSELRFNPISKEWVIISTERAKRPRDFIKLKEKKVLPEYKKDCPFCPGNENQTPEETFRLGDKTGWRVRAVVNLYGALSPKEIRGRSNEGLYRSIQGFGNHEVIIEHPKHNTAIPLMQDAEVIDIIRSYKQRYISIQQIEGIETIIIFKNHGPNAGTSLEHPHSQLIATPIVPPQSRSRIEQAVGYFDITGDCLFCRTLKEELQLKKRVILETENFVSFMPYAGGTPFLIWIFPRRHMASFSQISEEEIVDLARNLKSTLAKLYYGLDNPDYNYTIRSIPVRERGDEYFHWYISIIPRITQPAGFELGSGIFINTSLPEESAEFLRQVK
jgi:UDPglucose--hexose-1-phosphate uridylyltransferase